MGEYAPDDQRDVHSNATAEWREAEAPQDAAGKPAAKPHTDAEQGEARMGYGNARDADGAMDRLVEFAHRQRGAAAGRRVGVEHDRVAGGNDVDDVAGQGRDRVGRGCHRTDDTERRELLKRDAVITAAPVRPQPLDTRHVTDDLKLLDLVIESANLRFLQLDAAPLFVVVLAKALDDFDDSAACLDTLPA